MNVFPIDRRNKCLVQSKCDVVRNTISNVFDVFDGPSLLNGRLKILHHHLQKTASLNHVMSSLLELLKEGLFLRDQSKQHCPAPQFRSIGVSHGKRLHRHHAITPQIHSTTSEPALLPTSRHRQNCPARRCRGAESFLNGLRDQERSARTRTMYCRSAR